MGPPPGHAVIGDVRSVGRVGRPEVVVLAVARDLRCAAAVGMGAEDVYNFYLEKNKVNFQRQDSGYTKKDEGDSRHIGG